MFTRCAVSLQGFVLRVWCSLDYAFYFSACVLCVCVRVCLESVHLKSVVFVAERISGCHRGGLLCKAGASLINVC